MVVSQNFRVGFRSVDSALKIKPGELLNMFVDVAGLHSEKVGEAFGETQFRWLLSGYRVHIERLPHHGEEITVSTWVTETKSITSGREFEVRDLSGNLLVTAFSVWALIDITVRKPVRISAEQMEKYGPEPERTNFGLTKLPKIAIPEKVTHECELLIDWKWIDINNHMNNSYYIEVVHHFAPKDFKSLIQTDFDISYKQEIPENTLVKITYSLSESGLTVCFKNIETDTVHTVILFHGGNNN